MIPALNTRLVVTMLLLVVGLAWVRAGQALTITPIPPTATQVSPTQETTSWQTDATTSSDLVQYGLSYTPQWAAKQLTIGGLPQNETIYDVEAVSSQRVFVLTNATGTSLYETTNGGTTWARRWLYLIETSRALELDLANNAVWVATDLGQIKKLSIPTYAEVLTCNPSALSLVSDMEVVAGTLLVVGSGSTDVIGLNVFNCAETTLKTNVAAADPSATSLTSLAVMPLGLTAKMWVTTNDVAVASYNGSGSWTTSVLGTVGSPLGFEDIGAVSLSRAYAVGRDGGIYVFNSGTWTTASASTNLDFLSVGVGSDNKIFAFGCCSNGTDYYSFSGDGVSWSLLVPMTTDTGTLAASFVTPNVGWIGGLSGRLALHSVSYPSSQAASTGTTHSATLSSLQEATYFHANAVSNTASQTAESGNFAFKTQELTITDPLGPTATTTANSATVTWNTPSQPSLLADSRVYASPAVGWDTQTNVAVTTFKDIEALGDTAYSVGGVGNVIVRSTDLGSSWSNVGTPPNFAEAASMSSRRGWVVGYGFIMRTDDGVSWVNQAPPAGSYLGVHTNDGTHAWAVGFNAGSGIIVASADSGSTWKTVLATGPTLRDIVAVDGRTVIAVGDSSTIYRSKDSGMSWSSTFVSAPPTSFLRVDMLNDMEGWAVGTGGVIVQTTDGGLSWIQRFNGCTGQTIHAVAAVSTVDVWFAGSNGTVLHATELISCPQVVSVPDLGSLDVRGVAVDGASVWIAGAGGFIARFGVDITNSGYRSKVDSTLNSAHSVTINTPALTPNTTYNYFVQSYDAAGYTAVSPLKTFTTQSIPQLQVTPSSLSFTTPQGQNPAPQAFTVKDQNNGTIGAWNLSSPTSWLASAGAVTPTSGPGTPSDTVTVTPDIAGLTVGTYTGTITVNATGPGVDPASTPKTVNVTLTVTPPPKLVLSSNALAFSAQENSAVPVLQAVDVTNGGGGTLTYTVDKNVAATWLDVTPNVPGNGSPPRFATPSKLNVAPNTTAMAPGTYNATMTVDGGPGVDSSPQQIAVTYTITAAPRLQLTPGPNPTRQFSATQSSGTDPAPQDVVIQNAGGGTISWNAANPVTWLTLTNSSDGNGPTTMRIQARNTLAAGDYTATITVTATSAGPVIDSPQTITVLFHVDPAPVLSVSKTNLVFTTTAGTNPPEQTFVVQSGAPAGWSGVTAVAPGLNWLSITPASGTNYNDPNDPVHVNVDVAGLSVGTYNGTITISSIGASPPSVVISVTLNVTAPPVLDVSPRSITVTTAEGTTTTAQLQIFNNGGATTTMNWDMPQPTETWVQLSLTASCAGPFGPINGALTGGQSVVVTVCIDTVNPARLTPGTFNSTLLINAPGAQPAAPGVNNVPVTLNVVPDTAAPTVVAGSIIVESDATCGPTPYYFGRIRWQTSEPSDSRVEWGEQLTSGVPQYELGSLVKPEGLDTAAHTGGVTDHEVILDNLNGIAGGHTYYARFASMDRYSNVSPWTDHFEAPRNNEFLSFSVPTACDTTPPTNVVLTVPPGALSGTVNVNISAEDQSRIDRFAIYDTSSGVPVATITVPAAACFSTGPTFSCSVTYALDTRLLPDGQLQLFARAYDLAGNYADSPPVTVTINNAVPRVSNVQSNPSALGNGLWQASITWDTDLPSSSLVDYGMEADDGTFSGYTDQRAPDDSGLNNITNGHQVTLTNLPAGHIFHYRVTSCSAANPALCGN